MARGRRGAASVGVVAILAVGFAGCSSDGDDREAVASTTPTTAAPGAPVADPPLPVAVNAVPYVYAAQVGLATWKLRILGHTDPFTDATPPPGSRYVAVEVWIENGALEPQTVEPDAFLVYDRDARGSRPLSLAGFEEFAPTLAGGEAATGEFVFEVADDAMLSYLVFDGAATYGAETLDAAISLDPDFVPDDPN